MAEKTIMIACSMLKDEIEYAMKKMDSKLDIVWMEKGLHEYPEKLHDALQCEIDKHKDVDVILLAYCLCGNSILGLTSSNATLIIPKFDDCIRMLMTKIEGEQPDVDPRCMYYTRGWIDSERFIISDFKSYIEKYGEKKALYIMQTMLHNYTGFKLIDTGGYNVYECVDEVKESAVKFDKKFEIVLGCKRVLDKIVSSVYDDEFVLVKPKTYVKSEDFEY